MAHKQRFRYPEFRYVFLSLAIVLGHRLSQAETEKKNKTETEIETKNLGLRSAEAVTNIRLKRRSAELYSNALIPGRVFPSISIRKAPPPVEI